MRINIKYQNKIYTIYIAVINKMWDDLNLMCATQAELEQHNRTIKGYRAIYRLIRIKIKRLLRQI